MPRRPALISSPIGIDLGSRVLRAVQLDGHGQPRARLALVRDAPGAPITQAEVWTLAESLERLGFAGHTARVTIPKRMLRSAMIELPPEDSGAPLALIARAELARVHGLAADDFELAWWTPSGAGPPARGRVIAVSADHAETNALLDMFESASIDVRALSPGVAALARAAPFTETPTLMVDLGWSNADVFVVAAGRVLFQRSVPRAAFATTHAACRDELRISDEAARWMLGRGREGVGAVASAVAAPLRAFGETLGEELRTTRAYAEQCWPHEPFDHLVLAGGGASDAELAEWLEAALGIVCEPCRPAPGVEAEDAAAVGLILPEHDDRSAVA